LKIGRPVLIHLNILTKCMVILIEFIILLSLANIDIEILTA
jgi:hypothetical protein